MQLTQKIIQDKIPNNWIPIKYSSLSAKEKENQILLGIKMK